MCDSVQDRMFPLNDVVCSLLDTPFDERDHSTKVGLLVGGRPKPALTIYSSRAGKSDTLFQPSWYDENPWLCGSLNLQRLFCWPCLIETKHLDKCSIWNRLPGFGDFANAARAFHAHGDAAEHAQAVIKLEESERTYSAIQLSEKPTNDQTELPQNDVVCSLLDKPFDQMDHSTKVDLLVGGPPKPCLAIYTTRAARVYGKVYELHFQPCWYDENPWLCGSLNLQRLFCWPCLIERNHLHKASIWNRLPGFGDFANAARAFHAHGDAAEHLQAMLKLKELERTYTSLQAPVSQKQTNDETEVIAMNRQIMKMLLYAISYSVKHDIPPIGDPPENNANLKELFESFLKVKSHEIRLHYDKLVNNLTFNFDLVRLGLVECVSNHIRNNIQEELAKANCFSLLFNCTTEKEETFKCYVIVKYVTGKGSIEEHFLGFHVLHTNEQRLHFYNDLLKSLNYREKMMAYSFLGTFSPDVPMTFQKELSSRIPDIMNVTSSDAHLYVVFRQTLEENFRFTGFFDMIDTLANLLSNALYFQNTVAQPDKFCIDQEVLAKAFRDGKTKKFYDRDLWFKLDVISILVLNYSNLRKLFINIVKKPSSEPKFAHQCLQFLKFVNDPKFAIMALSVNSMIQDTKDLYIALERNSFDDNIAEDIDSALQSILVKKNLQNLFTKRAMIMTSGIKDMPEDCLPDDDVSNANGSCINYVLFHEPINVMMNELKKRKSEVERMSPLLRLVNTSRYPEYLSKPPVEDMNQLTTNPRFFTKPTRLKTELKLFFKNASCHNQDPRQVLRSIRDLNMHKDVFQEVDKLFCFVLSLPSSPGDLERMGRDRLGKVARCHRPAYNQSDPVFEALVLEKQFVTNILEQEDMDDIINRFAYEEQPVFDLLFQQRNTRRTYKKGTPIRSFGDLRPVRLNANIAGHMTIGRDTPVEPISSGEVRLGNENQNECKNILDISIVKMEMPEENIEIKVEPCLFENSPPMSPNINYDVTEDLSVKLSTSNEDEDLGKEVREIKEEVNEEAFETSFEEESEVEEEMMDLPKVVPSEAPRDPLAPKPEVKLKNKMTAKEYQEARQAVKLKRGLVQQASSPSANTYVVPGPGLTASRSAPGPSTGPKPTHLTKTTTSVSPKKRKIDRVNLMRKKK